MEVIKYEGKNAEQLLPKALKELNLEEKDVITRISEKKGGLFKGTTYVLELVPLNEIGSFIKEYLTNILSSMKIDVKYETKLRDKQISVKMFSDNNSLLIGKKGQTLTALQNLLKQVIYTNIGMYPYIVLDVENYKDKQLYHLEVLAKKVAREVSNTKIPVALDNMNSYERRIIHNTLTNYKGVTSTSEGEEPNRHVVIKPKE